MKIREFSALISKTFKSISFLLFHDFLASNHIYSARQNRRIRADETTVEGVDFIVGTLVRRIGSNALDAGLRRGGSLDLIEEEPLRWGEGYFDISRSGNGGGEVGPLIFLHRERRRTYRGSVACRKSERRAV